MLRWIAAAVFALAMTGGAAVAFADVPPTPPEHVDRRTPFERGRAFGRAIAPLCCGCIFMAGAGAAGGIAYWAMRRNKSG